MTPEQMEWSRTRDELVRVIRDLGFPEELGSEIAKMLGSPKAMRRMISYLYYVEPMKEDILVDEALAIASEIAAWKEKKAGEEANSRYNEVLNYGFDTEEQSND